MYRIAHRLLLAAALLIAQHGALLHDLSHAAHDAAAAAYGEDRAPALGHPAHECIAYGAIAHALGGPVARVPAALAVPDASGVAPVARLACTRFVFDSRAPPFSA